VIPNGVAVRQVDRLPLPDREKRPKAEIGHTLYIAFRIATGVLVEERVDRGGHARTVAVVADSVNPEGLEHLISGDVACKEAAPAATKAAM
jgi:hypothetical protein